MTTYVDFEAYRVRCEDLGITPNGLAKKARVSSSVIHHMKHSGTAHPATVLTLARALGCAVSDLVVREGPGGAARRPGSGA